ncbi:MAG: carbon storage regulator CsrA [Candidatus Brocadiaceae bacterium]|nr:carbon storage regulator CsrA [Candidatus Brocadiaceae bacterium]
MLILTRRLGESITIGNEIKVILLECQGKQVKLGITAPATVKVHREEIYEKIQEENQKAATASKHDLIEVAARWRRNTEIINSKKPISSSNFL